MYIWESGFLKAGSMEPPLCTNGSAGYLMQLSVKVQLLIIQFIKYRCCLMRFRALTF